MIRDWTENRQSLENLMGCGREYFAPKMNKHNIKKIEFIIDRFGISIICDDMNDNGYIYQVYENPMMNPWSFKNKFKTEQDIVDKIKEEFNFALEEAILINV